MNSKSKAWIEFTLLILLLCMFGACRRQTAPQGNPPSNANATSSTSPAPSASPQNKASTQGWTLDNNQRAKLSDYLGKVVVLDFYATWCEPCREETPHLVQLQLQYEQQGLQIIGLNVGGEDDREEVPKYAKEFNIQYPLGFPDDEFVDAYMSGDQLIPETVVFDRSGKIVKRFVGYDKKGGQELERVVQATVAAGTDVQP